MKLTCDLCGGPLQMNMGGQNASCTACGLMYPMDRLREMLGAAGKEDPPRSRKTNICAIEKKEPSAFAGRRIDPATLPPIEHPDQFVMCVDSVKYDCISGSIQQGGIGIGDKVYINYDYSSPYTIYSLDSLQSVKAGMHVNLYLTDCPRKVIREAQVVTGIVAPAKNAYNYHGTPKEFFAALLAREFPDCEIYEDVPHEKLRIPVSLMVCRGGKPMLAVYLIHSGNGKGRSCAERAQRELPPEGIAVTHFFEDYRNDAPYVIERVRSALGK